MRKYVEYVKGSWTPEITMSYLVFGLASLKGNGVGAGIAGFQPVKTCLILGAWSILLAIIFVVAAGTGEKEYKDPIFRLTIEIIAMMGFCILGAIIMVGLIVVL